MLDRHSLFWKLAVLLVGFCLLMIGLSYTWGRHMETQDAFLSEPARQVLRGYAQEAEQAWREGGQAGVDAWLRDMAEREHGWAGCSTAICNLWAAPTWTQPDPAPDPPAWCRLAHEPAQHRPALAAPAVSRCSGTGHAGD